MKHYRMQKNGLDGVQLLEASAPATSEISGTAIPLKGKDIFP